MYAILSANDIIMSTGLRKKIETIGEEILDQYCQASSTSKPTMIPPVPDSKFLEKFPEGELDGQTASYKDLQDGYEAEVKVYRCFEELKRNVIVIHQIEYTHEQYSAFVPLHNCTKKSCNHDPEVHPCHQPDKNLDGETDFVVIGPDFVAVFEVKGLTVSKYQTCCSELISKCCVKRNGIQSSAQERNAVKFEGCFEDAARQRNRMVNLIKHLETDLDVSIHVYQFTIFPNISKGEIDQGYLSDTTLLFSEDIETFTSWFDANIPSPDPDLDKINSAMESVKSSLLGLWCINTDNKWSTSDCSVSKCILNISAKLKRALVTQRAVDRSRQNTCMKHKRKKQKIYPENPGMVEAPDLFKDNLNISCLTQDQLDVFNCEERFLWVEGPAGSGKTIVMLGKIIDIVLNKNTESRILVITSGWEKSPAVRRTYHEVLDNISEDISCTIVQYDFSEKVGDIDEKVATGERSLIDQLSSCSSGIVILALKRTLISSLVYDMITCFGYVFVDDYQRLIDGIVFDIFQENTYTSNILSEGLLPVIKKSSTNNTSLWVFCDMGQCLHIGLLEIIVDIELIDIVDELSNMFIHQKLLSVNLRNTHEISSVLSVIRKHLNVMEFTGAGRLGLPQQKNGHFLRGIRPTIYLLRDTHLARCIGILEKELCMLRGPDSSLAYKDIAVLCHDEGGCSTEVGDTIMSALTKLNMEIEVWYAGNCMSSEWPAVLSVHRTESIRNIVTPDNVLKEVMLNMYPSVISELYSALSRARVYSAVVIYNYKPNDCKYTDKILSELRERRDICRILDVHVPDLEDVEYLLSLLHQVMLFF